MRRRSYYFPPGSIEEDPAAQWGRPQLAKWSMNRSMSKVAVKEGWIHSGMSPAHWICPPWMSSWVHPLADALERGRRHRHQHVTPSFKAKIGWSSHVCPGSRFHTYGQNYSISDKTSVINQSTLSSIIIVYCLIIAKTLNMSLVRKGNSPQAVEW
jgi:hypothetical protein